MSLTLYYHPLSSYCWKALIAFYENDIQFEPHIVNLGDEAAAAAFKRIWPVGRFPVLRDAARDRLVPESSIIIEYLAQHYPGRSKLLPEDADLARQVRFHDRFFDNYVMTPMQKIVFDRIRPAGRKDPHGVEEARTLLDTSLRMIDETMASRTWATGETFTLADCAAAPSLYYADRVAPFTGQLESAARYLERLKQRPSFARVLKEAEPYFQYFPNED
ncbi:MAG: glutathione S-transferase family protein [Pseudomonadota bacterium]|nr:glutathione S-transferase family protein [Pseudomonadota bacterium]